jgi:NAD-specific glutamate dehydrogenase
VLALSKGGRPEARISAWVQAAGEDLARWQRILNDMRAGGTSDFATLSVGIESVRKLTDAPRSRG